MKAPAMGAFWGGHALLFHLSPLGARVETALRRQLAEPPSFVAFEGDDTIAVHDGVLSSPTWTGRAARSLSGTPCRVSGNVQPSISNRLAIHLAGIGRAC